ncbi:MAG: TetR/AcrR family transcriptional regulator [Pseudodonghicola sp.]
MSELKDLFSLRESELAETLTIASARTVAISALLSFSDIGFHATTTRHITERASVSAGSLYTYFKSKEDILNFWMLEGHKRAYAVVEEAVARTQDAEERIAAIVRDLTLWHIRYQTLSQVNTTQLRALKKEHYVVVREYRRKIVDALRAPVEEGVQSGAFSVPTVEIYLNAVFAIILDVARWFPKDEGLDPEEVADGYARLVRTMLHSD